MPTTLPPAAPAGKRGLRAPAESPPDDSPAVHPLKIYRGYRTRLGHVTVTVDGRPLSPAPSRAVRDHSPDGFNWGYAGSGPTQLALAILLDVTGDERAAEESYQDFKRQFVATWDDSWEVTSEQVREWLELSQTKVQ